MDQPSLSSSLYEIKKIHKGQLLKSELKLAKNGLAKVHNMAGKSEHELKKYYEYLNKELPEHISKIIRYKSKPSLKKQKLKKGVQLDGWMFGHFLSYNQSNAQSLKDFFEFSRKVDPKDFEAFLTAKVTIVHKNIDRVFRKDYWHYLFGPRPDLRLTDRRTGSLYKLKTQSCLTLNKFTIGHIIAIYKTSSFLDVYFETIAKCNKEILEEALKLQANASQKNHKGFKLNKVEKNLINHGGKTIGHCIVQYQSSPTFIKFLDLMNKNLSIEAVARIFKIQDDRGRNLGRYLIEKNKIVCIQKYFEVLTKLAQKDKIEILEAQDKNGSTLGHYLARNSKKEGLALLFKMLKTLEPPDLSNLLTVKDNLGNTIGHYLAQQENSDLFCDFLELLTVLKPESLMNVFNQKNNDGQTIGHILSAKKDVSLFKRFLDLVAKISPDSMESLLKIKDKTKHSMGYYVCTINSSDDFDKMMSDVIKQTRKANNLHNNTDGDKTENHPDNYKNRYSYFPVDSEEESVERQETVDNANQLI